MKASVLLPISDERAERLTAQMLAHADDAGGACPSCRRHRCVRWQDAFVELAAGGRIAVDPLAGWDQVEPQPPHSPDGA